MPVNWEEKPQCAQIGSRAIFQRVVRKGAPQSSLAQQYLKDNTIWLSAPNLQAGIGMRVFPSIIGLSFLGKTRGIFPKANPSSELLGALSQITSIWKCAKPRATS